MDTVLISVILSAVITIMITAKIKKEIMNYVSEICNLNIEQTKKIKECALSTVEKLVRIINQNKPE